MSNLFGNIINVFFFILGIFIIAAIAVRAVKSCFAKEKEVFAEVVDKQSFKKQMMSTYKGPYEQEEYVIFFQSGKKKLYFNVSKQSFSDYKVNQKGKLRYKGNKLIRFK